MEGWWVEIAASIVAAVVSWVGVLVRGAILRQAERFDKTQANQEAVEALLEGMAKMQDSFGRGLKAAAADGKLTATEIETLQNGAWSHAKDVATGKAKEVVLQWSAERVKSLIKQLLAKYKGKK